MTFCHPERSLFVILSEAKDLGPWASHSIRTQGLTAGVHRRGRRGTQRKTEKQKQLPQRTQRTQRT